jgi:hypothetical protein
MKLQTLLAITLATVTSFSIYSCSKENSSAASSDKSRLQVFLTDDPGSYDAVVIDVQDIMVNYSSDSTSGWESLSNVNKGSYDILKLVNDKDTLLGDAELNPGKIEQIRLILGSNNYVTVNGQNIPLTTPSAQQSGLKLNINKDVNAGVTYKLLLDFDASRSIVRTGNGKYILKPVIRTSLAAIGGSIKGFVLPDSVHTAIYAIQGADTITGTYTSNGSYMVKGLNAGSYTLAFAPADSSYKSQNVTGVNVTTNAVTTVDTVRLAH